MDVQTERVHLKYKQVTQLIRIESSPSTTKIFYVTTLNNNQILMP